MQSIIRAIRRNHALEHGTVTIMLGRRGPRLRLVGRAVTDGFFIYGRVPTEELVSSAYEALSRFKQGEGQLALTPLCGTNIAVSGLLSGVSAALAIGRKPALNRLPNAVTAAMFGAVAAQPVGRLVQRYLTTRADLDAVEITGVRRGFGGRIHKVETRAIH